METYCGKSNYQPPMIFRRSGKKGTIKKVWDIPNDAKLKGTVKKCVAPDLRLILQSKR